MRQVPTYLHSNIRPHRHSLCYYSLLGNIYIGDYNNNRIRKVTVSTGIITTIAGTGTGTYSGDGGAATSAALKSPSGIALDSSGNHTAIFLDNSYKSH